jgi:hypothetical protein
MFLRGLWKSEGKSLCDALFFVFVTQTALMFNDVAQTLILFIMLDSRSISYEKLPTFFLFFNYSACLPLVAGHANAVTYVTMASVVMAWRFPLLYFARDALYISFSVADFQNMNDVTKKCICEYVR